MRQRQRQLSALWVAAAAAAAAGGAGSHRAVWKPDVFSAWQCTQGQHRTMHELHAIFRLRHGIERASTQSDSQLYWNILKLSAFQVIGQFSWWLLVTSHSRHGTTGDSDWKWITRGPVNVIELKLRCRRKFRSETSDNMDSWKAEVRRVRRDKIRRKKMQMREKVGKSRNTVFFQWFVAPVGRTVGSLKRRVRSQLARWEMKKCTPLWREAHFQVKMYKTHQGFGPLSEVQMSNKCTPLWREAHFEVKMYKTHQVRTTFGGSDVEKVHAVVARSTFPSQNVKNTTCPDHFLKFRCRKSARRCGAKHISKSKVLKTDSLGPLLEVQMSKKCTPLWREAHFQVKMLKTPGSRTTFGGSDVASLRFITLHYTPLHYTPLHYITLHYIPQHYNYNYTTTQLHDNIALNSTTLNYTPLHSTTLNYTTVHYTPLHYTTLHYTPLHSSTLNYTTLHYTTLHSFHYTPLHYTTTTTTQLHSATLKYSTLHYTTLHYTTLHYTTLPSTTLHYITLHYIPLDR